MNHIFQGLAVIYILGLILTALLIIPLYWNRSAGRSKQAIRATRIACVTTILVWPAFFGGAFYHRFVRKPTRR